MRWKLMWLHGASPGRAVFPRQRDWSSATLRRRRAWKSCGRPNRTLTIDFVMCAEEGWGALLDMPAPLVGGDAIVMTDWQGFSP